MKRIIYKPSVGEVIPASGVEYTLPINGPVVDALVPDDFLTSGTILYDSLNGIELPEPFVHNFARWEP